MSHFIFTYAGNKRNEFKEIINNVDFKDVKNIIEPFAGTSAISFNIWKIHKDKFNYYLNDNSKDIYNIYELFKNEDGNDIIDKINVIKNGIKCKEDFMFLFKNKKDVYDEIVIRKMSSFRYGLFKGISNSDYKLTKLQLEFIEFIKCPYVYISNNDWIELFKEFKHNENSIFFLDPPYLNSCNDFYSNKDVNIYEYLYYNKIKEFKSHIFLILEDIWIIKLLFQDNKILNTYNKEYSISKKKTSHILIYNK